MRLATAKQTARIDELCRQDYGLSDDLMMEAAGVSAAREIMQTFLPELSRGGVAVVCGPGHNGADGLVVARHLHSAGHRRLRVFMVAPGAARSEAFSTQLERVVRQGIPVTDLITDPSELPKIKGAALIVDAIFGVGLNREVTAPFAAIIDVMNEAVAPKLSLDTPSGLNCDTGMTMGRAVRAGMTLTFSLAKPGFFVSEGPAHVGRLRTLAIGQPRKVLLEEARTHYLFGEKLARRNLLPRADLSNKSDHGKLLVLAGREGYWGAGLLASASGFRAGAGYVYWAGFEAPYAMLKELPEVLTGNIADENLWRTSFTAACVGPGLGVGAATAQVIERLRRIKDLPVVVDADAITACVEHKLFPLPAHWILTPHAGELARVLKISAAEIEGDRFHAAKLGARIAGCHVLLKGFRSVLAYKDRCVVIHSGNSALAKAGTGDVLTGIIGGFLAQGLKPLKAAAAGAYLHGRMADDWIRDGKDKAGLTASDLKELLPRALKRLRD